MPDHSLASNRIREPGALPIPTASHTSMFGNRVRETGSLSSHTETGSVRVFPTTRGIDNLENEGTPGLSASPVNNLENEDEDEAEDDDEDEEVDRVGDDLFSPDPIDDPNLQNDLNAIKVQLQELARTIHDSPFSRDPTTRLHQIRQETKKLSEFKDQETRIVGFIGETGTGECFLLFTLIWTSLIVKQARALSSTQSWTKEVLHARYAFKFLHVEEEEFLTSSSQSGAGGACTSVPMEYRYVDEKHPRPYTIEADFMSEDEVNDLLEELLRSIRRATIQTDRSLIGDENWEQYEAIGKRSHQTLEAIFTDRSDLTVEYLASWSRR